MKQLDFPDGTLWADESSEDEKGFIDLYLKLDGKWEFSGKLLKEPRKIVKDIENETT